MFLLKYSEVPGQDSKVNREFIGNPIEEFSEMFDGFNAAYGIRTLVADDDLHKKPLKPKHDRVCRFCGATYCKEEKFKSKAHLLPSLIGNRNLFSDFECDKCNNLFGKYENHLANFLGLARVMNIENIRSGKKKFVSPDKTFIVYKDKEEEGNRVLLESHGEENNHFTLNEEEKTVTFHTTRPGYNPHLVWKSFLKMGLSLLPDRLVNDYEIAFAILRSEKKNEEADSPLFKMNVWVHRGPAFPTPLAILFERRDTSAPIPMHVACIMFHNYTYQLVLPLSNQDRHLYDGKTTITVPNMPPFIDKHFANEFGTPTGKRLNFNLDELKHGERHDLSFSFDSYTDTRLD